MKSFSQLVKENQRKKGWSQLDEAVYNGNLGFEEMVRFYKQASATQEKEMDKILKSNDAKAFKKLISKVLGVKLK